MKGIIVFIILVIVALLIFIYTGTYNVAATKPHTELTLWVLNTTREYSISSHAEGIKVPPLDEDSLIKTGFRHYKEMCVGCHGAPGVDPSEIGKGLNPEPPELSEEAEDMSPAELFWITKNGIKMTGMPAFGSTHSDEELWAIVAFLMTLPETSQEEYQEMVKETEGTPHKHEDEQNHHPKHNH
ncbi:cytochrome c [Desulfobacterota bacterium AH_259_B03_O07]|nr:cytochrome c [Desulfobacterota bacterium AH_259_B03_O07]